MRVIPALLRELGKDPESILASVGLDAGHFRNPDHRFAFQTAGNLLAACATATRLPHFGLLVGARFDFEDLGILAHLMRDASTVKEALLGLVRHLHLTDRGAVPFLLDLGEERIALGYVIYRHDTPGIGQVYDLAIAVGYAMLRVLCGADWKPLLVTLAHDAPRDTAPYRRFFHAPVRFNAAHSELVFPTHWLERPIVGADVARRLSAERTALDVERGEKRLTERVQRTVQGLVMAGEATAPRVASLLGMHERVLRRHLQAEGTNLHALLNGARFEVAQQLLQETQLPITEIAAALHYSDATAFSRAFRNWARMTPSAWRNALRDGAGPIAATR